MKVIKGSVFSSLFIIGGSACAEDVNGKWGGKSFYGFAEAGMAHSDINLNSSSVTSGSYTYTESVDKNGTILKLEFGMSIPVNVAVEV